VPFTGLSSNCILTLNAMVLSSYVITVKVGVFSKRIWVYIKQRRCGLQKLGARSCNFPTAKIMGGQKLNLDPQISPKLGFSAPNFVFLKKIF